ncbi:RsmB/NOP family class I SAM-dependent RNA methyltransferase [Marinobacterium arenosum]|uniref:RsmB/NOP family class I SAM-dependent RNA methyltransferase n=1 Tax=Marinobacterium arenosum TaxID=2862496 RepID=UPI001C980456|nr:RsmB/NOP family class I SAM-dependent RNA methyltransferase [Marinobacterium arenosum]MBY4678053.1 RsmB/NOP family class I SAM-dependent RNA methyltransferase [Marinobacterium arenosum]
MTDILPPLPEEFLAKLEQLVPADRLDAVRASYCVEKPTSFRVNTLKAGIDEVRAELEAEGFQLQPVDWFQGAFTLMDNSQRRALTETAAFYDGRIYIQNLSSMIAPLLLAPQPEETVLDLAAAPGGKTLLMAAMMDNRGTLNAVEAVKGRYFKLKANLEQQGASMVRTYLTDGRSVGSKCPEMFDRVLLDAPCSSEARFSRLDPASWAHWSPRKVKETAHKQKRLLQSALYSLKPGGCLIYCTCALSPEEDEMIVHAQLHKFGDAIEVEPVELPFDNWLPGVTQWGKKTLDPQVERTVRILPSAEMDGFYISKLRKHRSF